MKDLKIDSEFHNLIPPLTPEEYAGLEQKLINEGFNSTVYGCITVWDNKIVDGHNRYEICTRNNIPYETEEKMFNSRDDAIDWIINNQLSRRNLQLHQRTELAFTLEDVIKERAKSNLSAGGGDKKSGLQLVGNPIDKIHTDDELGKIARVSKETIRRARIIREEGTPEQVDQYKTGQKKITAIFKEVRPKEEGNTATKMPGKQKTKEKETEKKLTEATETITESIFNISRFERVTNQFLCEINPLSMGYTMFANMDDETRQKYIAQINDIRRWLVKIENIINGGK